MENINLNRQYTIEDLEKLLDSLPSEIWLKDENGKIVYANKSFCKHVDKDKIDVIGKSDYDLRYTRDADICSLSDNYVANTNKMHVTIEYLHTNDDLLKYKVNKIPINSNNRKLIGGYLEKLPSSQIRSCNDNNHVSIVERTKNTKLINKFEKMKDKFVSIFSKDVNTAKCNSIENDFFTSMSHEFKTPINIILATTQLILSNVAKDKSIEVDNLTKYMHSIKQNSLRLLRLLNNILDSSKIDGGYYTLNLKNYNIVSVIEDIVMSTADYIKEKNRNIIFDTDEEELILACDPDKIEIIILNLLSNSLKYTSDGGNIDVNIEFDSKKDMIYIHVKNDGLPIPKGDCKKIFNRFIQSETAGIRKCDGTGIGLSLSKSLAEMHGGTIWAVEGLDKGAEFIFSLPITNIADCEVINTRPKNPDSKIERFIIEFSDIYSDQ